jgi:tetratricopeptide (TPR) repeat protein
MNHPPRPVRIVIALGFALSVALPAPARADDTPATHEAAKHFQRGVALYGETDYRAALVEFKRAYATSPNVAVLYNVGETEYQLQDYASALSTFERYLGEASPTDPHRAEVEGTVEILRARVGHLAISTNPPGADVTVDDVAVGKTPLDKSVLVSIGRRKVVAALPGRPPISRYVDVAADDTVPVALFLPAPEPSPASSSLSSSSAAHLEPSGSGSLGRTLRTVGWLTAGASALGAITFGVLAMRESSELQSARASYPTTAGTLQNDANLTQTYSLLADSLTAAAIVIGGITIVSTFTSPSSSTKRGMLGTTNVSLGPGSARFEMSF